MDTARQEFKAAWRLVLAAGVGFGLGLSGMPFYTAGVFVEPLNHAFGWTGSQIQSGVLVTQWSMILGYPLAGALADRFGPRRVAMVSAVLFSLSYTAFAFTGPDIGHFRIHWGITALAGAGTLPVVWSRMITGQFVKGRGLAL